MPLEQHIFKAGVIHNTYYTHRSCVPDTYSVRHRVAFEAHTQGEQGATNGVLAWCRAIVEAAVKPKLLGTPRDIRIAMCMVSSVTFMVASTNFSMGIPITSTEASAASVEASTTSSEEFFQLVSWKLPYMYYCTSMEVSTVSASTKKTVL